MFTGTNVSVLNGLGATHTTNGLGNLIVGYNEPRLFENEGSIRTGSHNVVGGTRNNYSSYGGLVVGDHNNVSGTFSSVIGGWGNTASGDGSSVTGGLRNTASGYYS